MMFNTSPFHNGIGNMAGFYFAIYGLGRLVLSEVMIMDSAIKEADERMVYITGDEDAIQAYERRFKMLCDRTWHMNIEMEECRAEGLAEGKIESATVIAGKLKARNFPPAEIAEVTGLTLETIEQL